MTEYLKGLCVTSCGVSQVLGGIGCGGNSGWLVENRGPPSLVWTVWSTGSTFSLHHPTPALNASSGVKVNLSCLEEAWITGLASLDAGVTSLFTEGAVVSGVPRNGRRRGVWASQAGDVPEVRGGVGSAVVCEGHQSCGWEW